MDKCWCPITGISGSDKATISVASGHQEYHPRYLSLDNITNARSPQTKFSRVSSNSDKFIGVSSDYNSLLFANANLELTAVNLPWPRCYFWSVETFTKCIPVSRQERVRTAVAGEILSLFYFRLCISIDVSYELLLDPEIELLMSL